MMPDTHYFVEVIRGDIDKHNMNYQYDIVGFHEQTGTHQAPTPLYGGSGVIEVNRQDFYILKVFDGDLEALNDRIQYLRFVFGRL